MVGRIWLVISALGMLGGLVGCQSYPPRTARTDATSIPDRTYEVTEYHGKKPLSYAVLFDIPDDGMPVVMAHTYLVKRIGLDSSTKYIDYFETRIKGYKTLQIMDQSGTVRAYLLMTNFLYYQIYERPVGEKILVWIEPPHGPVLDGRDR